MENKKNYYRFHYIHYNRLFKSGDGHNCFGIDDFTLPLFTLPDGVNEEEGFKILSYLYDICKKYFYDQSCDEKWLITAIYINLIINDIGFNKEVPSISAIAKNQIKDLYLLRGETKRFKKDSHVEWYKPNITLEEVQKIYETNGMKFNFKHPSANIIDDEMEISLPVPIKIIGAFNQYFSSYEEYIEYCKNQGLENNHYVIYEYLKEFNGRENVIKAHYILDETDTNANALGYIEYYTKDESNGYHKCTDQEPVWNYLEGGEFLSDIYYEFKKIGVRVPQTFSRKID